MSVTLEKTLCATEGFGLTRATPVQRAICKCVDGLPLGPLAALEDVQRAFGGPEACAALPLERPAEVLLLAAIRSGKSMLAAAAALRASQTCDVSKLGPGETPRVSVLSLTVDLGHAVFGHLCGTVMARPALRALLIGEPTADALTLRHPSGRAVEVKCVAGAKSGASLVSRWSAGVIFDEAPRMNGADDGVINYDDARRAVVGRLLPGAQILSIGSPWAPMGPIFESVEANFGKPSRHIVVIRASGPMMNPGHWTPERCAELSERDPVAYQTDVLGNFADPSSAYFDDASLRACIRKSPIELPREPGVHYVAAQDAATRANAWTLTIASMQGGVVRFAVARQWKPKKGLPLSPAAVLDEVARLCRAYGVDRIHSDAWSGDALNDIAKARGITLEPRARSTQERYEMYENLRTLVSQQRVELPPVAEVRSDLLSVRRKVTMRGVSIELPTSGDGRHADYAPSLCLSAHLAAQNTDDPLSDADHEELEQLAERLNQCRWAIDQRGY